MSGAGETIKKVDGEKYMATTTKLNRRVNIRRESL